MNAYEKRVRELEDEGLTTSDAQSAADVEFAQAAAIELKTALYTQTGLIAVAMQEGVLKFPKWFGIHLGESLDASRAALNKAAGNG